ncbi:hypothetical protein R3P38DRAFT_3167587 [Favolaschia claudopus]|uniref:Uncharacterized protein n=1 Tax=Favolaschia claudopus TaxID=2862362 RepID=A0AAV9Z6N9_9AGAR
MSNPWSIEKKRPFYFPPPDTDLNANINDAQLPSLSAGELARFGEETVYESGERTLVGLKGVNRCSALMPLYFSSTFKDHVFDVTSVEEFGPKGKYGVYAFKDISFALVKGSILEQDTMVLGYSSLSQNEIVELEEWYSAFL